MKNYNFSFVYGLLAIMIICISAVHLYQSLYRNAIRAYLANQTADNQVKEDVVSHALAEKIRNFPLPLAYDLGLSATLYQWQDYRSETDKFLDLQLQLREEAAQLRPSWAPNHVERSKLSRGAEFDYEKAYLKLAHMFGPFTSQTLMRNIDYTFSHWQTVDRESKIIAARQLVSVGYRLNYRSELNEMITFSPGKQRICNVLLFNKLSVQSCK